MSCMCKTSIELPKSLFKGLIELLGDSYEPRVLRLLVLEELAPITELATAPVLADAFRSVFKCER